jgi:hypothetical protein
VGLWEVVASGRLPVLAKLHLKLEGCYKGTEVEARVVPAFEAVADNLTYLQLDSYYIDAWLSEERVGYHFGVALGKLRRLEDLCLLLCEEGRAYQALAQGVAATGVERPLPLLREVVIMMPDGIEDDADLMASVIFPSVRVFDTWLGLSSRAALLLACALRQAGYKHTWRVMCGGPEF